MMFRQEKGANINIEVWRPLDVAGCDGALACKDMGAQKDSPPPSKRGIQEMFEMFQRQAQSICPKNLLRLFLGDNLQRLK